MSPMSILTQSNALHIPLPDGVASVMCTSPPYYHARKYEGAQDCHWPACRFSTPYCSEWSGQLGWEPTPDMFIAHLVAIMSEVKRVLAPTGVAWIVIGDKYITGDETTLNIGTKGQLLLIPHRLALALQSNGWLVRNDLVWSKSSANPESVGGWRYRHRKCSCARSKRATSGKRLTNFPDRPQSAKKPTVPDPNCPNCKGTGYLAETQLIRGSWRHTRAHEYVLMLTKQMGYYADHLAAGVPAKTKVGWSCQDTKDPINKCHKMGRKGQVVANPTANPRTVLTPKLYFYKGSHSAPFNPDLIGPLLRATCPGKVCVHCHEPWAPYIEHGRVQEYRPTCDCQPSAHEPGLVLDVFCGSGTTGLVCKELGLNFVGMDVSWGYLRDQAQLRVQGKMPRDGLEGLPMFSNTRSTP